MSQTSENLNLADVPCREVSLPEARIATTRCADGSLILRFAEELRDFDPNVLRNFRRQAALQPDKTLYAQRQRLPGGELGDWQRVSFAEAERKVLAIGQWLLDQDLQDTDAVLIISGNSIAHALVRLGSMATGLPVCPISANYALMGGNYERLKYVIELVKPKVIFAEAAGPYADALAACDPAECTVLSGQAESYQLSRPAVSLDAVYATPVTSAIEQRIEHNDPDAHAVYMLTSGSTGMPKAVIQTQRMLSTNLFQAWQVLGKAAGWSDVMLDWLPWSHVSGAFNLLAAAVFGGTLYIDDGKPAPGLFAETLRNLREIAVPYFCNVPTGFAMLVDELEQDEQLQKRFFSKLRMVLYGGAGLPQPILDRLQRMAIRQTGGRIFMTTGYGATETASGCMAIYFHTDKVGIGLPMPGLEVKLVPQGDRFEVRLRGDNVMPGYLHNPESSASVFDEDGFYRTGDAARFHDEEDIEQGLYFAGRLAEEFKLGTGTWVYAGQVRGRVVEALAPAVSDILLCGIGRDYLAVLGVPNPAGLRDIAGPLDGPVDGWLQHPAVQTHIKQALERYNAAFPASSTRVRRFAFMREAPSAARYELSDKGTLNQRIAAESRSAEIDELYAETPGAHVFVA